MTFGGHRWIVVMLVLLAGTAAGIYLQQRGPVWQDMLMVSHWELLMVVLAVEVALAFSYLLGRLHKERDAAERSRKCLHDGLSNLNEAFAMFDRDGHLVLANQAWENFYPWLENELYASASWSEVEELNSAHIVRRTLSGNKLDAESHAHFDKSYYLERVDKKKWYLASDSKTEEGGLVCVRSDVTESKRAELQLRKMSRALEQCPASVVITDTDGNIEYVNPKFEETSGYSAEESLGRE